MGMVAWAITVNPDTNEVTYCGFTNSFQLEYNAMSIGASKVKLPHNTCKMNDIIALNIVSGNGNLKPDNRCGGPFPVDDKTIPTIMDGPAFYYGVITAVGDDSETDITSDNDEVSVSDLKYFYGFNYTVESGNWITGNINTILNGESTGGTYYNDAALSFLTNLANKWMVCSPLSVSRLVDKHYAGKVTTIRFPEPDSAGTENMTDTISHYYENYGIVFVPYGDLLRNTLAPRSSNDNLLKTAEAKAAKKSLVNNGITFVNNGNGSYNVNGKCTAVESLYTLFNCALSSTNMTVGGQYRVYNRGSQEDESVNLQLHALINGKTWQLMAHVGSNNPNGAVFVVPAGTTTVWCRLQVPKDAVINNQSVTPSIVIDGQEQPIYNATESTTTNGITFTNNYDGTYTLHGTCNDTVNRSEALYTLSLSDIGTTEFRSGITYSCGIFPKDTGVSMNVWFTVNGAWDPNSHANIEGTGGQFTVPANATKVWVRIRVQHGKTITQKRYRPYICVGTNTPYQVIHGAFISGDDFGSLSIDTSKWIKDSRVNERPIMDGEPNGLNINTVNTDDEGNFASVTTERRYITKDRRIVKHADDPGIVHPIKMTTYNYSPEKESKTEGDKTTTTLKIKSADDIAKEQLRVPLASSEINFKISVYHPQVNDVVKLGNYGTVFFKNKSHETIVSRYTIDSNSEFIDVQCGNVRDTLEAIIHESQATASTSNTTSNSSTSSTVVSGGGSSSASIEFATPQDITNLVTELFK